MKKLIKKFEIAFIAAFMLSMSFGVLLLTVGAFRWMWMFMAGLIPGFLEWLGLIAVIIIGATILTTLWYIDTQE